MGILTRGLISWKNFYMFMTSMAYTNANTRFMYFSYAATKQLVLLIPVFRIPIDFNMSWHHISAFFLLLCFIVLMIQRGPECLIAYMLGCLSWMVHIMGSLT